MLQEEGTCSNQMSPSSLGTLSSADMWDNSSDGLTENLQNDRSIAELFEAGFSSMVQQLNESHNHVALLECEVKALTEEKLKQECQNQVCVTRLKDQIRILEQKAELDLEELKRRQNQIEAEVPSLEEQIKSLKNVLHDLNVSEALYSELIVIPKEARSIREHILVLAYEKMVKFHNDLQSTRQERDASREALSRANDEVQKLKRDMQRIATSDAVEKQSKDTEIEALISRNERLETELQSLDLQLQVLSAKGALYDELRCKIVQLEELLLVKEREKTETSKALQNINKEKSECEKTLNEKQHYIEVLQMEKAYANGQFKTLEEQVHKLETEKISQQERIHELEEAQKRFYDRVLSSEETAQASREQLVHEEKLQLQERNKQELDLLRTQIAEAADFELQMLRKTRDLAVSERDSAQAALQESRAQNEHLIERVHELKLETTRGLKLDYDGVSRREAELQKMQEGTYHELCQVKIENKVLTEKLQSSTQNFLKGEGDITKALVDLKVKLEGANASLQHYQTEEQLLNEALLNSCKVLLDLDYDSGVFGSIQAKLDMISTLVRRYKMLQENLKVVESDRELLKHQLLGAEEKMDSMSQKIACMKQPTNSLVNAIQQKDKTLKEALQMKETLENKLREVVLDKNRATSSFNKLRDDLRRVLEARGNMESLKQILMEKDPNLGNAVAGKLVTLKRSPRSQYGYSCVV